MADPFDQSPDTKKDQPRDLSTLLQELRTDIVTPGGREKIYADLKRLSGDARDTVLENAKNLRKEAILVKDGALQMGLDEFDKRVSQAEKEGAIATTMDVAGDAIKATGERVGDLASAAGKQMQSAADTLKDMTFREFRDHLFNPNESTGSKVLRYSGIALVGGAIVYGIYKTAKAVSNMGLKEGEEPGMLRKLLKWTGVLALSTATANFIGKRVLASQKEGEMPPYEEPDQPNAASEKILTRATFLGTDLKLVEKAGAKAIEIGGKRFRVARAGQQENLAEKITTVQSQEKPPQLLFNGGLVSIDGAEFNKVKTALLTAGQMTSVPVHIHVAGSKQDVTLEFTPDSSS